jgi:hypothetical protein
VSELAERVGATLARASGNTVGPGVAGLMMLASVVLGNPDLAIWAGPASALAGSATEEMVDYARATLTSRLKQVEYLDDDIQSQLGVSHEDLVEQALGDPKLLKLLADTVQGAAEAHDTSKVHTLAQAYVRGARDGALVDEMTLLVEKLRGVGIPEIRLLSVLAKPGLSADRGATPHQWSARNRGGNYLPVWPTDKVSKEDPGLSKVIYLLYPKLVDAGLAEREASDNFSLTPLGFTCAQLLADIGVDHSAAVSSETA